MKVVALIDCPGLIRHILEHLNLWEPVNEMTRPRSPPVEISPQDYLFPGEDEQMALSLGELGDCDGVDEIPADDVPTIIYG